MTYWWLLVAILLAVMYEVNRRRSNSGRLCALLLVCSVVGILLISGSYNKFHETLVKPLLMGSEASSSKLKFGIMFDAGSTGSRIHALKFKEISEDKPLVFIEEYYEEVKPGLSSYAQNPPEAANSLKQLLENAKAYIPSEQWESTPIALKATAGLRLLPRQEANDILNEVTKLFQSYPFKVLDNSIAIMDGTDEGLFSWFTVNYYLGSLEKPSNSYAVMDLGGGSTQITFIPDSKETLSSAPQGYTTEMNVFNQKHKIYTHSYLGLGLMSGRLQTMGGKQGSPDSNPDVLTTACFPAGYETRWQHGGKDYTIKGQDGPESRADACYQAAKSVFGDNIHQPVEVKSRQFVVISYYFDRAQQAGLVQSVEGGTLTVQDYINAANQACQITNPSKDKEFLCLDLSYISALLVEGFGFSKETSLQVKKRVNGREISWALGAMFQMMPGSRAATRPPGR